MNQISEGMGIIGFGPDETVSLRNVDETLFQ